MTWFLGRGLQTGEIHSSTQPADLAASDPKAQEEGQSPLAEVNFAPASDRRQTAVRRRDWFVQLREAEGSWI